MKEPNICRPEVREAKAIRRLMRIRHIAAIGFIGLLAVLAVGCSRMTADKEAEVRKSFGIPADMPMKDLGVVELRAGIPKRVRLGAGKDCTLTATVLTNGLVRLKLLYEWQGEVIDGVKTQSHAERSQLVFHPESVRNWRLCLPPMGGGKAFREHQQCADKRCRHLAVAMQPTVIP